MSKKKTRPEPPDFKKWFEEKFEKTFEDVDPDYWCEMAMAFDAGKDRGKYESVQSL